VQVNLNMLRYVIALIISTVGRYNSIIMSICVSARCSYLHCRLVYSFHVEIDLYNSCICMLAVLCFCIRIYTFYWFNGCVGVHTISHCHCIKPHIYKQGFNKPILWFRWLLVMINVKKTAVYIQVNGERHT